MSRKFINFPVSGWDEKLDLIETLCITLMKKKHYPIPKQYGRGRFYIDVLLQMEKENNLLENGRPTDTNDGA